MPNSSVQGKLMIHVQIKLTQFSFYKSTTFNYIVRTSHVPCRDGDEASSVCLFLC